MRLLGSSTHFLSPRITKLLVFIATSMKMLMALNATKAQREGDGGRLYTITLDSMKFSYYVLNNWLFDCNPLVNF